MKQKYLFLTRGSASYHNFFCTPESLGSLTRLIADGWCVMHIEPINDGLGIILEKQ